MSPKAQPAPVPDRVTLDDAGDPEMSLKDVELMLEADDKAMALHSEPAPIWSEPKKASFEFAPVESDGLHALDRVVVGSKVVVVKGDGAQFAVLAGPDGATTLPAGDPAHKLPEGARIRKVADDRFESEQLSPAEDHPMLVTATAHEAVAGFVAHFHPSGGTN